VVAAAIPTKEDLRARTLAARRARTPDEQEVAEGAIARAVLDLTEVAVAGTVAAYLSIGTEPATYNLVETLRSRNVRVIAPVLRGDLDLDWAQYGGLTTIAQGSGGLWNPAGPLLGVDAIAAADVVVVPALAVDERGNRLGRGGGSYDRALARVPPGRLVAALLYDGEWPAPVPTEPHDRPVSAVVTPSTVHRFAG